MWAQVEEFGQMFEGLGMTEEERDEVDLAWQAWHGAMR